MDDQQRKSNEKQKNDVYLDGKHFKHFDEF